MEIILREAQLTDYDQINALFTEELAQHIQIKPDIFQMPDPVMTESWYKEELENAATVMYVADVGGHIGGVIQIMVRNSPNDPIFVRRRYAHIEDIVVSDTYRGQGIGRYLMDAAQKWAKDRGASAVDLWVWAGNNNAIEFYKHLGYSTVRHAMQIKLE